MIKLISSILLFTTFVNGQKVALGWDEGVSLKLFLGKNYGIGVSVLPEMYTNDYVIAKNNIMDTILYIELESRRFITSLELFRKAIELKEISLLPYIKLIYELEDDEKYYTEIGPEVLKPGEEVTRPISRHLEIYKIELGLNFQKIVFNRFIFGTRIGVQANYSFDESIVNSKTANSENYHISLASMKFQDGIKFWFVF